MRQATPTHRPPARAWGRRMSLCAAKNPKRVDFRSNSTYQRAEFVSCNGDWPG